MQSDDYPYTNSNTIFNSISSRMCMYLVQRDASALLLERAARGYPSDFGLTLRGDGSASQHSIVVPTSNTEWRITDTKRNATFHEK